jgi:hypothetical protein
LQVGQCKSGQGAWGPGELPQDNAAPRARRLDKLKWHARALVDRTRCPILEASLAAKARWPWLSHFRTHSHPPAPLAAKAHWPSLLPSRTCPTHPPPKGSAKPQGGWVGETCPSSEAPAARVLWQGQATPLALTTLAAMSHCARSCASQERLLVPVVALLLELVSLPKHVGRHCCSSGGIPTRPKPLIVAAKAHWPSLLPSSTCPTTPIVAAPHPAKRWAWETGGCSGLWRLVKSLASLQKLEWPCKPMRGALSPASRACLK